MKPECVNALFSSNAKKMRGRGIKTKKRFFSFGNAPHVCFGRGSQETSGEMSSSRSWEPPLDALASGLAKGRGKQKTAALRKRCRGLVRIRGIQTHLTLETCHLCRGPHRKTEDRFVKPMTKTVTSLEMSS